MKVTANGSDLAENLFKQIKLHYYEELNRIVSLAIEALGTLKPGQKKTFSTHPLSITVSLPKRGKR